MTDGIEGGSHLAFGTLIEKIKHRDSIIFSIHLDSGVTERGNFARQVYKTANRTLPMLAEETGGNYHRVKQILDLKGVYEKIANELSLVYSLGYEPKHQKQDGSWQTIEVKIKTHPDLLVRTKKGYYAQ